MSLRRRCTPWRRMRPFVLLLLSFSSSLFSQVRTYPSFYVSQKGTYGTYREAAQTRIYHLSTEFSLVPSWSRSFCLLYRESRIDYDSGFIYKQNQFIGSYSQLIPSRSNFFWSRFDISFVSSNADLTNKNVTIYAETGFQSESARAGIGLSGFTSKYTDVRSYGASAFAWAKLGGSVLSSKFSGNTFSGNYHHQKKFYSGSVSLYLPSNERVAFLFSGIMGRRSFFYDSDIKLVYNLTDIHLQSAAATIYFYASRSLTIFLDGTIERYESYAGGKYRVFYLTLGGIMGL